MDEVITIKIKYGSDFQRETWSGVIGAFCTVLADTMERGHKENKVEIVFGDDESCSGHDFEQQKDEEGRVVASVCRRCGKNED